MRRSTRVWLAAQVAIVFYFSAFVLHRYPVQDVLHLFGALP